MSQPTVQNQAARALPVLLGTAVVLAFLYLARMVVIPVALAVLFTFLLAPLVNLLQRRGLPRVPAVGLVTVLALGSVIGVAMMVTQQIGSLLDSYPRYEQNVTAKIAGLRAAGRDGLIDKLQTVTERIQQQLEAGDAPTVVAVAVPDEKHPTPVRIVEDGPFKLSQLWMLAGPVLEPLANIGLVLVLVIFMLINREDLRDRIISLIGANQLAETTRALGDAGERVSRYLLMQLAVNAGYGLAVTLGLWLIGVPYAPLWGFFAALLRYIPYLGPWLAALLPIMLSLLIEREWGTALAVVALFGVLELITNMLVEPWLYGRGIGVSQAALLIAVAFWTWLWGPVGLVLASPLTVCLVVLGRYVPYLRFLDTLLGDRPTLTPAQRFYQRLLADDEDEAEALLEKQAQAGSQAQAFDEVVIPALAAMRADERSDKLDTGKRRTMTELAALVVGEIPRPQSEAEQAPRGAPVRVVCVPARDGIDAVAADMLARMADPARYAMQVEAAGQLTNSIAERVEAEAFDVVAILSVPPGGIAHTRHLCKRIRAAAPGLRIVAIRPGLFAEDVEENRRQLMEAGASRMAGSLSEGLTALHSMAQLD